LQFTAIDKRVLCVSLSSIPLFFSQSIYPKRMSLKEQKKYGGASMAGLTMRRSSSGSSTNNSQNEHQHRIENAQPSHTRMTKEAAVAFPALATEDPALYQLMESVDILETRCLISVVLYVHILNVFIFIFILFFASFYLIIYSAHLKWYSSPC
jgi:hypothetical protein